MCWLGKEALSINLFRIWSLLPLKVKPKERRRVNRYSSS
jgi:hypothetical protein